MPEPARPSQAQASQTQAARSIQIFTMSGDPGVVLSTSSPTLPTSSTVNAVAMSADLYPRRRRVRLSSICRRGQQPVRMVTRSSQIYVCSNNATGFPPHVIQVDLKLPAESDSNTMKLKDTVKRWSKGLTLVEVLIALTLLSIAILVIIGLIPTMITLDRNSVSSASVPCTRGPGQRNGAVAGFVQFAGGGHKLIATTQPLRPGEWHDNHRGQPLVVHQSHPVDHGVRHLHRERLDADGHVERLASPDV